ncbi:solute carrier family 13 member 2-like isoform X1 [Pseudochaenichthys georgianus]|uniref:solute carrier family 13 member 2-like isoform X1 n=1 Tax=Pseudochaenichthys georgianus TaxID=52239 RepID=UPI00146F2AFE|nr:solute carrier family 13 member 2-like isoform X1 [Pseudochaenichthys georgianus]
MAGILTCLWKYRNYIVIVLTPLLLLPLPLASPTSEAKCGYVIILMALYWCTECIPLAVTALLPVILFPMMGIMESNEVSPSLQQSHILINHFLLEWDDICVFSSVIQVCIQYLKDSNMLFIGGLLVAIAVEHWNLHRRIALQVLLIVGVKPSLLMIGFMGTTAFLSMWISNTASTAMMLPIANAVLQQLCDTEANAEEREFNMAAAKNGLDNQAFEMGDAKMSKELQSKENTINLDADKDDSNGIISSLEAQQRRLKTEQKYTKLTKGMSLSVCYAASIGGTATLTGTTPNVIMKGQIDELFPDNGGVINFASWFGFSFPNMVLMLALSWLWLQFMFLGFNLKSTFGCGTKKEGDREAFQVIKDEYKKLGRMSFAEGCVLTIFTLLVVLWFTREPGFIPGWATLLFNKDKTYVTDGTVAILMSALFFCIPSKLPRCCGRSEDGASSEAPAALLNWDVVHEKMPWNILLLLGGGFALAHGSEKSGLSIWLGESLIPLQSIPPFAISILLCLLVAMFTECSSNTATTTLFLPILASMATAIEIHPLYVMFPCTISASLAFMLPVATPPNAIAFSYGNLKVLDMAKAGFILNILGVITINIAINTWGVAMFNLNEFPSWANVTKTP